MIHLRICRPLFADHFRNNLIRTFCSKTPEDVEPPQRADKEQTSSKNQDINDKINDILKSMIESKESQDSADIKKAPVPEYGFVGKKRPKIVDPKIASENALKDAVVSISKALGNDPQVEKELIHKAIEEPKEKSNLNWGELIGGMQIDNSESVDGYVQMSTRSDQVRKLFSQRPRSQEYQPTRLPPFKAKMQSIDLFGGQPLGIFKNDGESSPKMDLKMWDSLKEYELNLAISHAPRNYFEKMARWTKQGKVWKFPIDNDQGMEEEKKIHFTEHIFLEGYLEDWCPKRGPIRHFMELVCVGMSKNPYMPVKDKKEHILWFRDYFESKRELLEQVGAYGNLEPETKSP